MDFTVLDFISNSLGLKLVVELHRVDVDLEVSFRLPDGSIITSSELEVDTDLTDPTLPVITYRARDVSGDGIYQALILDTFFSKTTSYLIGNLELPIVCLLKKAINDIYDTVLFTQLEATKHFIMTNNRTLAMVTYQKMLDECSSCTGDIGIEVSHSNINIIGASHKMV